MFLTVDHFQKNPDCVLEPLHFKGKWRGSGSLSHPLTLFFFLFFFLFEKLTHLLSLTIQTILEIQQGKLKAHPFTFSHALFLLEPKVQNQSMECLSLSCLFLFISLLAFAGKITSLRLSHFPFCFAESIWPTKSRVFLKKKKKKSGSEVGYIWPDADPNPKITRN